MIEPEPIPKPPLPTPEIVQRKIVEPLLGALVVVAVAFILFAIYTKTANRSGTTYALNALFSSVDGLQTGCDVRIGGVKVGQVADISIDPKTYRALVKFNLSSKIKLSSDSVASVSSEGLLGSEYLELLPGASGDMLKPDARIYDTKAPVSLFKILDQFISGPPSAGSKGVLASGERPVASEGASGQALSPAGAKLP